jgi:hypothetical protein
VESWEKRLLIWLFKDQPILQFVLDGFRGDTEIILARLIVSWEMQTLGRGSQELG